MARYWITIERWHPTPLNELLNCHWATAGRKKRRDREMVAVYSRDVPKALGSRRVTLTIVLRKGQRSADSDAYWKSLLDALVRCDMLVDDNPKHVVLEPVQFSRGDPWGSIIELEEL